MYLLACEWLSTITLILIFFLAMISHINSSVTDVCLVAIDFAGLSTNVGDLQSKFNCIQTNQL